MTPGRVEVPFERCIGETVGDVDASDAVGPAVELCEVVRSAAVAFVVVEACLRSRAQDERLCFICEKNGTRRLVSTRLTEILSAAYLIDRTTLGEVSVHAIPRDEKALLSTRVE